MENQVTSIEQSRRLLELGVPAEKASMRWGIYRDFGENSNRCKLLLSNQDVFADYATYIPAFTVADLLGMLPAEIQDEGMTLEMSCFRYGESWAVSYYNQEHNYGHTYICLDIIGALFLAVTHLINKGYKMKI